MQHRRLKIANDKTKWNKQSAQNKLVRQKLVAQTDEPVSKAVFNEGTDIFQVSQDVSTRKSIRLLTGTVRAKGPGGTRTVQVLLDTGSELAFMDKRLAADLKLSAIGTAKVHISTFGSNETKENVCERVKAGLYDSEGNHHKFSAMASVYGPMGFFLASNQAICAAAYLKHRASQNLLVAKSRLPSIQAQQTIPKLEIMAIAMAAGLALSTIAELNREINIGEVIILSDSEIALTWLRIGATTKVAGVLVANRVTTEQEIIEPDRFGSLQKLKRTMAYVLRFVRKASRGLEEGKQKEMQKSIPELPKEHIRGAFTGIEIRNAMSTVTRLHQVEHRPTLEHPPNCKLNLINDSNGLIQCYGRLRNSILANETKYPAFIAPNTALARLIIEDEHGDIHCAKSHTNSNARQRYWIPRLRRLIKKVIKRCDRCQRFNDLRYRYSKTKDSPEMGVMEGRPFLRIALDCFRPLALKEES
ncbi:hypothetical protein OESDEN_03223 [Oesophagostomum dentatum]|uniref:Integrase zinc-binding domain-containing protein n=1 Tax=Oesophagostomum dentatum TaxID=61180 RepID=A0A0B1TL36_OESDE|nr:hypothetical protein OESDEN_03223 [Oesophagostomum dentatum]